MRNFLRTTIYNRSWVLDIMIGILMITTIFFLVGEQNISERLSGVAKQNTELNKQNRDLLERVKSCTDPEGTCYKDNTQRTAAAIDQIDQISILAAGCADKDGAQTVSQIRQCVLENLKPH